MVPNGRNGHDPRMIRRFVALALWTYFAWYACAVLAAYIGGPAIAGPIAAALTAAVGAIGWMRASRRRSGFGHDPRAVASR